MNRTSPQELAAPLTADASPPAAAETAIAIRGGAIRVAGFAAGVLVSLGSATILVRYLGVSSFGRYVTVTSLVALVGGVTEAGIYVFGIREFAARSDPDRRRLLANLLTMRLVLTAVGISFAVCFGLVVGYSHVLVLGVLIVGAALLVQVIADVLSIPLQAELRLGRLTVVDFIRRVLVLTMIGSFALAGATLLPFFAASTIAGTLALGLLAWIVRASLTIKLSFDWGAWRELLAETLPFALSVSIGAIYVYVTVIIMSLIASAHQTGLFATSFRVVQVALGIPVLLLTAIFPLMSRGPREDGAWAGAAVGKVFTVALICGVWMSLAMAIGAPFIIDVIAGHKGEGAVSVLRIQGLVFIANFISTSSGLALVSLRRYRAMMIASICALALDVLLAVVLVPALGARGGAVADVFTEAIVAMGLTAALVRAIPEHQITGSIASKLLLAASLSATVLLVPVSPAVRAVAATVIYFGALFRLGAIPTEVIAAARRVPGLRALR